MHNAGLVLAFYIISHVNISKSWRCLMGAKKKEYRVVKKRSGRFAVMDSCKKYINGDKKVEILVKEGILKATAKKESAE